MAPQEGLVHSRRYDIKDSNVQLIGSDLDHKVKHASAATEPAWNNGVVGQQAGLFVWRIEDFAVVPVPPSQAGQFFDGDSYIVLHSYALGGRAAEKQEHLGHDIFFWLGAHTTVDEAGTAAYKTAELDAFLHGAAAQHREVQARPSQAFAALFPRLTVRRGGAASGFRHVEPAGVGAAKKASPTLLRVFRHAAAATAAATVVVHEVEPTWRSLDEGDVFVLDRGDKIFVWQGRGCSPVEKAKAAQVVHDMTVAKHVDVEVLAQEEARSHVVVRELGGGEEEEAASFRCVRPMAPMAADTSTARESGASRKLFRLSDASGRLAFDLVKEGAGIAADDLDGGDVFLLDDAEKAIWVWEGAGASRAEKASWLKVAQAYVRRLESQEGAEDAYLIPVAKVKEGCESSAFMRAMQWSA